MLSNRLVNIIRCYTEL